MARVIKYTKTLKNSSKSGARPKWRSIFKSSLPQELDDQKRSPWKYIIQCLIEDKTIPDYFYPYFRRCYMKKARNDKKEKEVWYEKVFQADFRCHSNDGFHDRSGRLRFLPVDCPIGEQSHFLRHCPPGLEEVHVQGSGLFRLFPGRSGEGHL